MKRHPSAGYRNNAGALELKMSQCRLSARDMLAIIPWVMCLLPPACRADTRIQALRAQDFVNAEGVNTHINYTDGAYANIGTVINDLMYLGIDHIRDGINAPGQSGSAPLAAYEVVARAGIKLTVMVGGGSFSLTQGTPLSPSLMQRVSYIDTLARHVPGSVVCVEGTNEINNEPIIFNGIGTSGKGDDELKAALAFQRALYRAVHADSLLHGVPVAYFTGSGAGTIPIGPDPATTPGLADMDTQHPYPNGGQPPAFWVSRHQALQNEADPSGPAIYTETGYSSNGGHHGDVNEGVQAKYTLDLLLDTARDHILATDLYELLDAYRPGSRQGDAGYGLFDYTGAAKRVAFSLHNLNALMTDRSPMATSFRVSALTYTVSGESATGSHLLFQKANGSYILALWDEQPIWDARTGRETEAAASNVRVSVRGLRHAALAMFDPLLGNAPLFDQAGTDCVVVVSDHPVFLRIVPGG